MRRVLPVLAGVVATLVAAPAAPALADSVQLGAVTVRVTAETDQVVTVNRTRGWHARVAWWVRTDAGWVREARVRDGRIGYGGLVRGSRRVQGTGTTPLGTYRLLSSFGSHARDASWDLAYRKIRRGDFWVQDNRSAFYNRYRNKSQGGFRWWLPTSDANSSERLRSFPTQYEYAVVTGFNRDQVRHRGSGIFLHVNGSGATGGCVSVPRALMQRLMAELDPAARPVIAVGR
ncbi:MAG: L,D-transpeptidase family protein [Nocardioidaceae bacterium]